MGETAEERARRLALQQNSYVNATRILTNGRYGWKMEDDAYDYKRMFYNICREMIDEVCDEPTVSLVKKYSKGSFKFV